MSTDRFNVGFRLGVERAIEVGGVGLEVARAPNWVLLVVGVDAAGGKDSEVDLLKEAAVRQVEGADNVAPDGLLLVILAPVDIGASGAASAVENISRLDSLKLSNDSLAILHADCGSGNSLALALQDVLQMSCDPSGASPDQKRFSSHIV